MKNFYKFSFVLTYLFSFLFVGVGFGQDKNPTARSFHKNFTDIKTFDNNHGISYKNWLPVTHNLNRGLVGFSEDFDGIPGETSGGAGTYAFPSGWVLVNADGLTPAANVAYVNEAWERREDFNFNVLDSAAFSTSWYSPAGQADDWMISPAIELGSNYVLRWNGVAYDPEFLDGYEVRISTTTQDVAGCLENPPLFSVAEENSSWTERLVNLDLAGYENQTVYIAWRNNSIDKFLLLIDDIVVEQSLQFDAQITSVIQPSEYTMIPLWQSYPIQLGAVVKNGGSNNINDVLLTANIYQNGALVHTEMSTPLDSIAPDSSESILLTSYTPTDTGLVEVLYNVSISNTDQDALNDSGAVSLLVSENEFARDNGIATGSLGIGTGEGELGQSFVLRSPGYIRSVKFYLTQNYVGVPVYAYVRSFENGTPTDSVAVTDTFFASGTEGGWLNLNIQGGEVELPADTFVVTVNEVDSTLTLGNAATIFTPGTVWVNWATSPFGGWANVEEFGIGFAKTFLLRPMIYEASIPVELVSFNASVNERKVILDWLTATELNNSGFSVERKAGSEWDAIAFIQGNGTSTSSHSYSYSDDVSSVGSGQKIYYRLKQIDFDGTYSYSSEVEVVVNPVEYSLSQNYPNPFNPTTRISFQLADESFVTLKVYDVLGNEVVTLVNEKKPAGVYDYDFNAASLASGTYFYTLKAGDFVENKKMILIK